MTFWLVVTAYRHVPPSVLKFSSRDEMEREAFYKASQGYGVTVTQVTKIDDYEEWDEVWEAKPRRHPF